MKYSSITRYKSNKNKYLFVKDGYDLESDRDSGVRLIMEGGNSCISAKRLDFNFKHN